LLLIQFFLPLSGDGSSFVNKLIKDYRFYLFAQLSAII
jgi:hypothetical protein